MALVTGVLPTVISPSEYQDRFSAAMATFFSFIVPVCPSLSMSSPQVVAAQCTPAKSAKLHLTPKVSDESLSSTEEEKQDFVTSEELRLCRRILKETLRVQGALNEWFR